MTDNPAKSLTPNLPIYSNARHFLRTIAGSPAALYHSMSNAIWEQRGNPQANASWTDPDTWIPQRLSGDEQALALRFWNESRHALNPRHTRGCWYLASDTSCSKPTSVARLRSPNVAKNLEKPDSTSVAEIDSYEGILTILQLVAERGPGWRSDFLPDFATYCRTFTSFHSDNAIKGALYDRLFNLIERTFVVRSGPTYEITDAGLAYLDRYTSLQPGRNLSARQPNLQRLAADLSRGGARAAGQLPPQP